MVNEKTAASPGVTSEQERQEREQQRQKERWLHALRIVSDLTLPEEMRLAALVRVQAGLADINPLKHVRTPVLLQRVLPPWAERTYLRNGRGVLLRVSRPPVSISDVFD
jgi:hypothetical protein